MNVLILNWRDPKHPLAGGAEISLLEHAKYWQKKGARIIWFGSSFTHAKPKEKIEGITYIRKGSQYTVHFWVFMFYLQKKIGRYDIVIDCFHFLPFFTPFYMKKPKIIALIHEVAKEVWFANLPWIFAFIGYHLEPYFFKPYESKPFITVSESTKKDLIALGISQQNISVIQNGSTFVKVKKQKKEIIPTVIFLGRIAPDKGIQDAILAYRKVRERHPDLRMWIVGKEQKPGTLKKFINNAQGAITYYGYVSEEKKFELLQRAWIMVHPSVREGWGLTVLEANSVGTPVIGYDVSGLRDSIIHNKTGLLIASSYKNLAAGIEKLLRDKKLYKQLSLNSKRWSRKFRWETSTKKSWGLLQSL